MNKDILLLLLVILLLLQNMYNYFIKIQIKLHNFHSIVKIFF